VRKEKNKMKNVVFPLYFSKVRNAYYNCYGEFKLETLKKYPSIEFAMSEERSGVFTLARVTDGKAPNAKRMKVLCPYHDQHLLQAIDSTTLVCTKCDPRLGK